MAEGKYVIAYDIGTTGVKTCIFSISDRIELVAAISSMLCQTAAQSRTLTSGGMLCVLVQIKL